jgi:putative two-component system response regulator
MENHNENAHYKVLIVDDVDTNLDLASSILNSAGYITKTASSGMRAIELAKESRYDLILLDIMMPIMSGIETCITLKKHGLIESTPVIFFTASDDNKLLAKAYSVGGVDYIRKPFFKEELLARVNNHIKIKNYERNLVGMVEEKTKEISQTQVQLMYILGAISDGHSEETHLHVKRVSEFTYLLARLYGLSQEESLILKDASTLHDIGKLGVSSSILHKADKLTDLEYEEMKKHPELGSKMLADSSLPLFKAASIVCLEHHEQYNGMGYPNALKGENIHIYGRIVAIADVFDALSFKRSYKESWSQERVLTYIDSLKGTYFDPQLVDIFFEHLDKFLEIYDYEVEKSIKRVKKPKKIVQIFQTLFNKTPRY